MEFDRGVAQKNYLLYEYKYRERIIIDLYGIQVEINCLALNAVDIFIFFNKTKYVIYILIK